VLDYADARHGLTAMMRTTGYSLSVTGQMQLDGRIKAPGVHAAWVVTPFGGYVAELNERGITVTEGSGERGAGLVERLARSRRPKEGA
jgi:lysine 6-dehydrogenase